MRFDHASKHWIAQTGNPRMSLLKPTTLSAHVPSCSACLFQAFNNKIQYFTHSFAVHGPSTFLQKFSISCTSLCFGHPSRISEAAGILNVNAVQRNTDMSMETQQLQRRKDLRERLPRTKADTTTQARTPPNWTCSWCFQIGSFVTKSCTSPAVLSVAKTYGWHDNNLDFSALASSSRCPPSESQVATYTCYTMMSHWVTFQAPANASLRHGTPSSSVRTVLPRENELGSSIGSQTRKTTQAKEHVTFSPTTRDCSSTDKRPRTSSSVGLHTF